MGFAGLLYEQSGQAADETTIGLTGYAAVRAGGEILGPDLIGTLFPCAVNGTADGALHLSGFFPVQFCHGDVQLLCNALVGVVRVQRDGGQQIPETVQISTQTQM